MKGTLFNCLVLLTIILPAACNSAAQTPTWRVGDWFDVEQTIDVTGFTDGNEIEFDIYLPTCRWTVTQKTMKNIPSCPAQYEVYVISFSNCSMTGTGEFVPGSGFPIDLELRQGTTSGEIWIKTDDLTAVRMRMNSYSQIWGKIFGSWTNIGAMSADDVKIDCCPYMQDYVWPLDTGMEWDVDFLMHMSGNITFNTDMGDYDYDLTGSQTIMFTGGCTGRQPVNGCNTYKVDMNSVGENGRMLNYYCPDGLLWHARKSMQDFRIEGEGGGYMDVHEITWDFTDAFHQTGATPTPTPAVTPTPTSSHQSGPEVHLQLSRPLFNPGDRFLLNAFITNGNQAYQNVPFVVVLDVYGASFFWHPTWTEQFNYEYVDIGISPFNKEILDFVWPHTDYPGSGLKFHAAFLTQDFSDLFSPIDSVEFGWN